MSLTLDTEIAFDQKSQQTSQASNAMSLTESGIKRSMANSLSLNRLKKLFTPLLSFALFACEQTNNIDFDEHTLNQDKQSLADIGSSPYGFDATFSYPDFSGQYPVASLEITLTDNSRVEVLDEPSSFELNSILSPRQFNVRVYYPSEDEALDSRYLEGIKQSDSQQKLPVISDVSWANLIGPQIINGKMLRYSNYENAFWNIKINQVVSNEQPEYPVLIFSHGYGYSPEAYSAMSAELASNGYIIISINHTFGANPTELKPLPSMQSEHSIHWAKALPKENIGRYLPTWSADQSFVIETLYQLNSDSESLFYGKLNLSKLGAFGHSYGGAASYLTASNDPRIKAVMDLDGTLFEAKNFELYQPFAFILSKNHQPDYDINKLHHDAFLVKLNEFEHVSFTDHVLWWQWDHDDSYISTNKINALNAVETTTNLVQSFFDTYLLENDSRWQQAISSQDISIITMQLK